MVPPQEFDTVIPMDPFLPYTNDKTESTLYYPFDQCVNSTCYLMYFLRHNRFGSYISLLAINPGSNKTIPISGVIGYGSVVGWVGFSNFYPTTIGEKTLYSIALQVGRQPMVRAFVIVLVVTNCRQSEPYSKLISD